MPTRPLNRAEVAELADRLRGLLDMVDEDKLSATTGMVYRIQGAVTALDRVLARAVDTAGGKLPLTPPG